MNQDFKALDFAKIDACVPRFELALDVFDGDLGSIISTALREISYYGSYNNCNDFNSLANIFTANPCRVSCVFHF